MELLPDSYSTMLLQWPSKFEPLLMKHVWTMRTQHIKRLDDKYSLIERAYNSRHHTMAISKGEFTWAYLTVKSRSVDWAVPDMAEMPSWFTPARDKEHAEFYCSAMAPIFDMLNHD